MSGDVGEQNAFQTHMPKKKYKTEVPTVSLGMVVIL